MQTIKDIVAKEMVRIAIIMAVILLILFSGIQMVNIQRDSQRDAVLAVKQVEQILEENAQEMELVQAQYRTTCLNNARTAAYILQYNPAAVHDSAELTKIVASLEVDEIHVFDKTGTIVAGTNPEYFGLSFDSGEQISYFKPLLNDPSLELVQEITPNTADGRQVQYSALWSEDRQFILQIGMYPVNVQRVTDRSELSHIFSLLRAGVGYSLYAIDAETGNVVGSTHIENEPRHFSAIGLREDQLTSPNAFYATLDGSFSYCFAKKLNDSYIVWAAPVFLSLRSLLINDLLLAVGLALIAIILVYSVMRATSRAVIAPAQRVNGKLRAIQEGDLSTKVDVYDSVEFMELSKHVNNMVHSLSQSNEKLEMSAQIERQKEELERQHTRLEAAVARAEEASRAKSEFLFNMSHDIRTPMNAIIGFTHLALESEDPAAKQEYLQNIDTSSKQLLDLVNNVLELSHIQNKKVIIEEQLVDLGEVLDKLRTLFMADMQNRRLEYTVTRTFEHAYLFIDVTHFTQIILNIVGNAIKYTPDGGSIHITVRELPCETPDTCIVETAIADSGIGMSEEFLEHAFESFARERTSTISGVQGTGLGLSIVKDLVDMMKGEVVIESRQGQGTTVTVRLPHRIGKAPDAHAPEAAARAFDPAIFHGIHILMAEDIDINAMIAIKLLVGKGCQVARARDGVECVDKLLKAEAGYYDLVLMDIQMPNMNGYQATQTIRAFDDRDKAGIPILALTANSFQEDRDKAAEVGMNGHIAKPLDPAKLFAAMAEVLTVRGGEK